MGKATREKPARLAEKLFHIRAALGLSQNGMLERLGLAERAYRHYISNFERGIREPSLPVLLQYARAAGVYVDALIDDEVDLPERLPARATQRTGLRKS
ncbi:MAG TPA: helix-turn-helix transcriptional regulator [Blastocatellia bacterium]|nr:helix-turn-helix transcriptional regulator [Blastocatellia bacterium]